MTEKDLDITIDQRSGVPLYEQICQQIRRKIEASELEPGSVLPTSQQLGNRLRINSKTAHMAMATLASEGYVTRVARRGTVVKGVPRRGVVAIYSYAALFNPAGEYEYYRLLISCLCRELESSGRVHRLYLGSETPDTGNTACEDLLRHLSSKGLIGVVMVNAPERMEEMVRRGREMCVPVVALCGNGEVDYSVRIDSTNYILAAVAHLKKAGKRRVGVIYNSLSVGLRDKSLLPKLLADGGLEPNGSWIIGEPASEEGGYVAATRLPLEKLDGLIVQDDVMAMGIDRRLVELGISVPKDLLVTAQWVNGSRLQTTLPFDRFEFNTGSQAKMGLALMQDAIDGKRITTPHQLVLPIHMTNADCAQNPLVLNNR